MLREAGLAGKRILFVLPWLELGGAERQALHLARHLKGLACDVRVWGYYSVGLAAKKCDESGIPWSLLPSYWPCRKRHYVRFVWRVLSTIHALRRERPDLIIAYCPRPCVSVGLAWRWSRAKAFIWSQRDCDDLRGDVVERFAYRRASAVICNAAHEVDYLRQALGETMAPISVVHNGLELAPCQKSRAVWRVHLGIAENAMVATMVANFRFQKDHATLVHAWRKMMEALPDGCEQPRLLLAGAGQESYANAHQLVECLGVTDSVMFLGQVSDISGLLAASDVGVLISNHEGLSNSILEYMATGLPVVATDLPANREALGDNLEQPLCRVGDVDGLASRLRVLWADARLRERLGAHNRQRSVAEFSLSAMCGTTVELMSDLLEMPHRPSCAWRWKHRA